LGTTLPDVRLQDTRTIQTTALNLRQFGASSGSPFSPKHASPQRRRARMGLPCVDLDF
jgi:hypothetical protein